MGFKDIGHRTFTEWSQFRKAIREGSEFAPLTESTRVIWRGQRAPNWPLSSAWERYTQGGRIARDVEAAVGAGEDRTAQPAALLRVSAAAKNITIRLPLEDLERARALARRRGLRYQTYVKMLLHQALAADERQLP